MIMTATVSVGVESSDLLLDLPADSKFTIYSDLTEVDFLTIRPDYTFINCSMAERYRHTKTLVFSSCSFTDYSSAHLLLSIGGNNRSL